ncbi:cyclase family protein [Candidatus Woesearchaeota archaeon]|nr:cyclase family protein [Candidatus Woesearchaeota archaeon]
MKIHDISMEIHEAMPVYPNNPRPSIKQVSKYPKDSTTKSEITIGSHTGTHVDARSHVFEDESGADMIPVDSLYGKCRVLDMTGCKEKIGKADLEMHGIKPGEILLLKTKNSLRGFENFYNDYVYIDDSAAEYLAERKIRTIGIDALSVKQLGNRESKTHPILIGSMTVFEGLDLSKVKPGIYIFAGLPLKIRDCDGAPARAILIEQ